MQAEITIPYKFQALFEIDPAYELVNGRKSQYFFEKYGVNVLSDLPKKVQKYYTDLSKVNEAISTGGRLSSKSFSFGMAAINWAASYNHKILSTRYTLKSTEDSIIPEFVEKIELLGYEKWFDAKKDRINVTHNDAEIVFKGIKTSSGNQTANLKSLKGFSRWFNDESEEIPDESTYDKIKLSIRHSEKKNLSCLVLNPATKVHWIYKKFFIDNGVKAGFNGIKNGVLYIHTTYKDIDKELIPDDIYREYEEAKEIHDYYQGLTDDERAKEPARTKAKWKWYKETILGGWLDRAEGVVYEDWQETPFPEDVPVVYGLDYGFSKGHETALVATHINHELKRIYIKQLFFSSQIKGTDGLADMLINCLGFGDPIVADSAQKILNTDLIQRGFYIMPAIKGHGSVRQGISVIKGYELHVDPSSNDIKMELENYVWGTNVSGNPEKEFDNSMDAFRYPVATQLIHGDFV